MNTYIAQIRQLLEKIEEEQVTLEGALKISQDAIQAYCDSENQMREELEKLKAEKK